MAWYHILCQDHKVIFANNLASESLLLGPECLRTLSHAQRSELSDMLGKPMAKRQNVASALPNPKVGETRLALNSILASGRLARTR